MIIDTKLSIPKTRGSLITRPHLLQRLNTGLNHKLTLITAPVGYGKSTLLSEWSKTIHHDIAWISLDKDDNNPVQFWMHMIESLSRVSTIFNEQVMLRYTGEDFSSNALVSTLINCLNRLTTQTVLIWDDFQMIEDSSIFYNMSYFLERLPTHVHVYIASRSQPKLALSRFRVEGLLNELDSSDLRFDINEAAEFFNQCTNHFLNEADVETVYTRTEGWIAGIRIVAFSLENNQLKNQFPAKLTVSGKQRNVADYFLEEVLMKQPEDMQQFLLKASILDRINASLSEAVTNIPNGSEMIRRLEHANLFLVSLDDEREWYRFHHLFQQFLRMQLHVHLPDCVNALHVVAGKWFEENHFIEKAINHYLSGEYYEKALHLLQTFLPSLPNYERVISYKWLNAIPDKMLVKKPQLFLTNAASLFLSGHIDEATTKYSWAINELEEHTTLLPEKEKRRFKAGLDFLVAFRSFLENDFDSLILYSKKYLENEPSGVLLIGFGSERDDYHPAWDIYISASNLINAKKTLEELLKMWSKTKNKPFYAHLCIDYGKLLYEWNRLEEAKNIAYEALAIGQEYNMMSIIVTASLMIAKIDRIQNCSEIADRRIKQLLLEEDLDKHAVHAREIELFQMDLHLKNKNTRPLFKWMQKNSLRSTDEISPVWMQEYYLFARILGMQGKTTEAMDLINRLLFLVNEDKREQEVIRLSIYKSLLFAQQEKLTDSFKTLEGTLTLAEDNRYVRTFLDEKYELEKLLTQYVQAIQNHHFQYSSASNFQYAKKLLELMVHEEITDSNAAKTIRRINSLTLREKTVLQYMNYGFANKEIAEELDVSLSTIKTHINNLYRKLGVNNRVLALQKAHEMNLL